MRPGEGGRPSRHKSGKVPVVKQQTAPNGASCTCQSPRGAATAPNQQSRHENKVMCPNECLPTLACPSCPSPSRTAGRTFQPEGRCCHHHHPPHHCILNDTYQQPTKCQALPDRFDSHGSPLVIQGRDFSRSQSQTVAAWGLPSQAGPAPLLLTSLQ